MTHKGDQLKEELVKYLQQLGPDVAQPLHTVSLGVKSGRDRVEAALKELIEEKKVRHLVTPGKKSKGVFCIGVLSETPPIEPVTQPGSEEPVNTVATPVEYVLPPAPPSPAPPPISPVVVATPFIPLPSIAARLEWVPPADEFVKRVDGWFKTGQISEVTAHALIERHINKDIK